MHTLGHKRDPWRAASPYQRYVQGTAVLGFRSVFVDSDEVVQLAGVVAEDPTLDEEAGVEYGIDWDGINNSTLLNHHRRHSGDDIEENAFLDPLIHHVPETLSHVGSEDPRCPFTEEGVAWLDERIFSLPYLAECEQSNAVALRQLWIDARLFAAELVDS